MGRFWIAVVIGAVAVAGHYDVPAGDYVGDRIFIVCTLLLLLVALAFPGEG